MSYDNICKFLAEQYPAEFVHWLLPLESGTVQLLKAELSQEPIRADAIVFLQTTHQILHLEFQTSPSSSPPLPFRMLDYSVRLKREYDTEVEQVVLFLKQTTSEAVMIQEYRDRTTLHRYRVLRLWEQDPAIFLNNPALLPFATLAQTDSPSQLLQEIVGRVARIEDDRRRGNVASCVEILAGLRFEKELIQQLFREDIMQESVIYQDILQRGIQQGQQQGLQQGRQREALALVVRLLNRRLGELPPELSAQIQELSVEQLELLGEAVLDFGQLADLRTWLAEI